MNEIMSALKSTLVEIADSKKALASLTTIVAAVLVLIGSKAGLSWLDTDTAKMIAGLIVVKGSVYVASQAHVDGKKELAATTPYATVTTATGTSSAS